MQKEYYHFVAKERVKQKKGWIIHFFTFLVSSLFLFLFNVTTIDLLPFSARGPWFLVVVAPWFLIVLLHYFIIYLRPSLNIFSRNWEENALKKELSKMNIREDNPDLHDIEEDHILSLKEKIVLRSYEDFV